MRLPWQQRSFSEQEVARVADVAADRVMAAVDVASSGPQTMPQAGVAGIDDLWYADLLAGGPDVNPLLSGRAKYQVYNEMRLSDATVRSALWMFKLPIRAAEWRCVPASDDPVDKMVAEFVAWQFGMEADENNGRLDLTWDESLQQALLYLDWGAMFEELVWAEPEEWTDADGDVHLVRPLARLAPRFPATVIRAAHDPLNGGLAWIHQDLPGTKPIPGAKLCHYAVDREGYNWWGTSLLRPMYGAWRLKKALMIAAGIGWDRHAIGTPLDRYPRNGGQMARMQAEAIGRQYRGHERGYIALEGAAPPATGGGDGNAWDFTIINGASSMADPVPLMKEYDIQIATAALQMFARLGIGASGNRAVGEILSDPFYVACQALAKHVAAVRTRRVVRALVDVNFGTHVDLPRIDVSKIQGKNVQVLAASIAALSAAGLTFTDVGTQNDLRAELDLGDLPDDLAAVMEGLPPTVGVEMPTDTSAPPGDGQQTVEEPLDAGGATTPAG